MSTRVYRVCRAIHARLDGEGAKKVGGRWNSPGKAVVYMAQSVSLAVVENLVHMVAADFPSGYVSVTALIPDGCKILTPVEVKSSSLQTQTLGDRWLQSLASPVLRVRSAVVPNEFNYLLNPQHPDFKLIVVESTAPFIFDERLLRR